MADMQTLLATPERLIVNGYAVEVRRAGARGAQAIVMIHGIGVSSRYFLPFAEQMAKKYDVAVLDLPGYGASPDPKHTLSVAELGRIVGAYVRQSYDSPVVLVGHSMGCQIVAHAAQQDPGVARKLILLGPTVNRGERSRRWQAWRLLQDVLREPIDTSWLVFGDYLRMGVGRYLRTSRSMIEDKIEDTLADCNLPVLIVRGAQDKIVSARWVHYLQSRMRQAVVREVPDAPHVVQMKKPDELAEWCNEFIDMQST